MYTIKFEKYYEKAGGLIAVIRMGIFAMISSTKFHSLLPIDFTFDLFKTQKKSWCQCEICDRLL